MLAKFSPRQLHAHDNDEAPRPHLSPPAADPAGGYPAPLMRFATRAVRIDPHSPTVNVIAGVPVVYGA